MIELSFNVNVNVDGFNRTIVQPSFSSNRLIFFDLQRIKDRNKIKTIFIGTAINIRKNNVEYMLEFPREAIVDNVTGNNNVKEISNGYSNIVIDGWFLLKRQGMYFKYVFELSKEPQLPVRLILEYFGDSSNIKLRIPSLLDVIDENKKETNGLQIENVTKQKSCMPSLYGFIHVQDIDVCPFKNKSRRYKLTGTAVDVITAYLIETHKLYTQYKADVFIFCSSFTSLIWPTSDMSIKQIKEKSYEAADRYTRRRKDIVMKKDYWCFVINDMADHWVFVILYKPYDSDETLPLMFVADSLRYVPKDDNSGGDGDDGNGGDGDGVGDDDGGVGDDGNGGDEEGEDEIKDSEYNDKLTRLYISICILLCFTKTTGGINEVSEIPTYMKDRGFVNITCYMQKDFVSCGYHALLNLSTFLTSPLSRINTVFSRSINFDFPSSCSSSSDNIPVEIISLFNNIVMERKSK
jgi:hypothetical protein